VKTLKKYIMKITNIKSGHSFELNEKEAADFFFRNDYRDYEIEDTSKKISDTQYYLACIGLFLLTVGSALLHLHLNY
jgi:hypothetical protein